MSDPTQLAAEAAQEIDDHVRDYYSGMNERHIVERIIKSAVEKAYRVGREDEGREWRDRQPWVMESRAAHASEQGVASRRARGWLQRLVRWLPRKNYENH